ncbi:hypothetical protein [Mycobacterium sp. URHB0021]
MELAHGYVAEVDRILAAAVSLFPAEHQGLELRRDPAPTGADIPDGRSGLAAAAEEAAARYRSDDARATALSDALHSEVRDAVTHAQQANDSARAIRHTATTGARAVIAEGGEPHNMVLLVSQMDDRLAAMQDHIGQTRQRLLAAAQKIQAHGAEMTATRHA